MILYHGSFPKNPKPETSFSRNNVDFGKGFYTTPLKEQAENWCNKFKRLNKNAVISFYEIDDTIFSLYNTLEFQSYSESWLDFIINCRSGKDTSKYDIIIGGVANDKVFNTIELYYDNLIDKKEAIKRLQYEKSNMQICFRNQSIINKHLIFQKSIAL